MRNIENKEEILIKEYEDIIYMSRPESLREKMSMKNRAAQFLPYAPLKGHDKAIQAKTEDLQNRTDVNLVNEL